MIIKVIGFAENRRSEFAKALSREINGIYLDIDSIFSDIDMEEKHKFAGAMARDCLQFGRHVVVDLCSPNENLRKHFGHYDRVIMIGDQLKRAWEYEEPFTIPDILDLCYNKNDDFNLSAKAAAKYLKLYE
jgi:hypothetical protein